MEKETQLETILGPLASFGQLGCSFGCAGGQKERPEGVRVRFRAKHKNINFTLGLVCFWSFGPPGRSPKAFPERHLELSWTIEITEDHFGQSWRK